MRDREVSPERVQAPLLKDLRDQAQVLVDHDTLAVAHRDAGRLLAAMLEREQPERGDGGRLLARCMHSDDSAHGQ